ncbi:hypothetical protein CI109_103509 [Kwoniella shandongensis]|uniref:Uncharacterized protein n=1 Tax=Kwoniella shandongensis TaxID=1734106 RepID=A0A5M6BW77_9TREE|nr:uncharacterized protein CI109_004589 [Kwoniella shandongensis]KAA5527054.1 hypothetical protein CI109_004589 [Kwoniella shandongensis]
MQAAVQVQPLLQPQNQAPTPILPTQALAGPPSSASPNDSVIVHDPSLPPLSHGAPPPLPYYSTHKLLLEAMQAWSITHSFALITTKSYLHRKNQRALFSCSCADRYQPKLGPGKTLYRITPKTKRTECPYRISALNVGTPLDGKWTYIAPTGVSATHNHPPLNPRNHAILRAIHRRLHPEIDLLMEQLLKEGMPPRDIVKRLEERFPECQLTTTDVNNFKTQFVAKARDEAAGRVGAPESISEQREFMADYCGADGEDNNDNDDHSNDEDSYSQLNVADNSMVAGEKRVRPEDTLAYNETNKRSKSTPADESHRRLEEANERVKEAKKMVERSIAILRAREAEARAIAAEVKAWAQLK